MAKQKKQEKTWVESQNFVLGDNSGLMEHLLHAIWKNCKRLGWDMGYDWRSDSFAKVDAWEVEGSGSLRLFFDTSTPGNLVSFERDFNHTSADLGFVKSLNIEIRQTLDEWVKKKGTAEAARVFYLRTGKQMDFVQKPTDKKLRLMSALGCKRPNSTLPKASCTSEAT
jgi:hypothetical protein